MGLYQHVQIGTACYSMKCLCLFAVYSSQFSIFCSYLHSDHFWTMEIGKWKANIVRKRNGFSFSQTSSNKSIHMNGRLQRWQNVCTVCTLMPLNVKCATILLWFLFQWFINFSIGFMVWADRVRYIDGSVAILSKKPKHRHTSSMMTNIAALISNSITLQRSLSRAETRAQPSIACQPTNRRNKTG